MLKRILRRLRELPRAAKMGALALAITGVVTVGILSLNSGGTTGVRTPAGTPTTVGEAGKVVAGAPKAPIGGPGSPSFSSPTSKPPPPKSGPPSTKGPGAPPTTHTTIHGQPAGPPTLFAGAGSYTARCVDGTTSSGPDIGRLCYGHRGVRYFVPRSR
jgi:hypothetical protein